MGCQLFDELDSLSVKRGLKPDTFEIMMIGYKDGRRFYIGNTCAKDLLDSTSQETYEWIASDFQMLIKKHLHQISTHEF